MTTPQEIAMLDVRKELRFVRRHHFGDWCGGKHGYNVFAVSNMRFVDERWNTRRRYEEVEGDLSGT